MERNASLRFFRSWVKCRAPGPSPPLLHKDYELMKNFAPGIVEGAKLMQSATRARQTRFGIKTKNADAIAAIQPLLNGTDMDTILLGDFYPSGDEYELVYSATGRLIPPAGIPLNVGCVVSNGAPLYNVHKAARERPGH